MKIKALRKVRKLSVENSRKPEAAVVPQVEEDDNRTTLDMTDWEDEFDFNSMRGLFFIQKGQFSKRGLCVTVRDGKEIEDRYIGGYNPYDERTVEQYCVIDRVTFHTIYGGSSYEKAVESIEKCIVDYGNDCERYFAHVSESTNEDFYFRHYEGAVRFSDAHLKKRAEEGRCWRVSSHMKRSHYAVLKEYGDYYEEAVCDAEDRAVAEIEKQKQERRVKRRRMKSRKVRKLHKR